MYFFIAVLVFFSILIYQFYTEKDLLGNKHTDGLDYAYLSLLLAIVWGPAVLVLAFAGILYVSMLVSKKIAHKLKQKYKK